MRLCPGLNPQNAHNRCDEPVKEKPQVGGQEKQDAAFGTLTLEKEGTWWSL